MNENQHTPMFTGEEITKIIARLRSRNVSSTSCLQPVVFEQANCSVSK
jgi:hypothetical protein